MFFRDSPCRERVAELYRVLAARVAWPMTLYVQYYNPEHFDYRAALPNPLIRIVPFHTTMFRASARWSSASSAADWEAPTSARWCRSANTSACCWVTAAWSSTAWTTRCSKGSVWMRTTGCAAATATITTGEPTRDPQPICQKVPPVPYTMASYLAEVAELFRGHEVLRDYARWLGARIVNCTRSSMIDAYERREG